MSGIKVDAFADDSDYVKWADVIPDSVPWWENSYVATVHHGSNDSADTNVSTDSTNVETGESNDRS